MQSCFLFFFGTISQSSTSTLRNLNTDGEIDIPTVYKSQQSQTSVFPKAHHFDTLRPTPFFSSRDPKIIAESIETNRVPAESPKSRCFAPMRSSWR